MVDPCLTSVYQPPDVAINKPLKQKIRALYQQHLSGLICSSESTKLKAGQKVGVSRENLVDFLVKAFDKINFHNRRNRYIAKVFRQCGLDPWAKNDKEFIEHLNNLTQNAVYKYLTKADEALNL